MSAPGNEIPDELFYNKGDLDAIRKVYIKKAPYVGKNALYQTRTIDGSAKRNITRNGHGGVVHRGGKNVDASDDGSQYKHYDEVNDPNYDSEEDTDGKELMKTLNGVSPMKRSEHEDGGGVAELIQEYKREIDHIIGTHYLKTLEVSADEIAHVYLSECNSKYEEKLRELLADCGASAIDQSALPIYEVIKRSIIKSFDYSNFTISDADDFMPTSGDGANRMEAISLLLVELCASTDYNYSAQMETGFDHIFEIINELNKDVPACNTLLACYLTRCIVDEIVTPSYIGNCLARCNDDAIDNVLDDDSEEADGLSGSRLPPPPPAELDSPAATAKVLQNLQYTNHSLNCTSMQFSLYCKERNAHVRDVLNKTKVHLSHEHYSSKLHHIWGVNTDEKNDEDTPSSTTRELKGRIDALLMEFLDNCSTSDSPSKGQNSGGLQNSELFEYTPPPRSVLETAYRSLKELGDHTLQYFAHEIVKRGVSHILLNYRCRGGNSNSVAGTGAGLDIGSATAAYMRSNPSALHLCMHLAILMHYCMCGEDTEAAGVTFAVYTVALAPLPPPLISKSQYVTGFLKFFESIVEPAEGQVDTSTLFYDVLLDAPHAPMLFYQLLLLSTPAHGGAALLSDLTKFDQLVTSLVVYHKK